MALRTRKRNLRRGETHPRTVLTRHVPRQKLKPMEPTSGEAAHATVIP